MPGEVMPGFHQWRRARRVASVPSLHGCHTQARSMDELLPRVKEAIELCLEVTGDESDEPLELVGIQRVAV